MVTDKKISKKIEQKIFKQMEKETLRILFSCWSDTNLLL